MSDFKDSISSEASNVDAPLPENFYPYSVSVPLILGSNIELELPQDDIRFRFSGIYTTRIQRMPSRPRDEATLQKRFTVHLEAFRTACEAERAAKSFLASLLWSAASKRFTLGFEKWTGDFPFAIRDRTISPGITSTAEANVYSKIAPEELLTIAAQAFESGTDVPQNVLTSMQFYASARLEATAQAQFIGLITALESLATQQALPDQISSLVSKMEQLVNDDPFLTQKTNDDLRSSFKNRVNQLRTESIRQAILRTARQYLPLNQNLKKFLDQAYGIRSTILHDGRREPDLHPTIQHLEQVLREMYASILRLTLTRPE